MNNRLIICLFLLLVSCKMKELPGDIFYDKNPEVRKTLRGNREIRGDIRIFPVLKNYSNIGVYYSFEIGSPHSDIREYKIFFYDTSVVKILKKEDYNKEVWEKEIEQFLKQYSFKARQIKKCIKKVDYYMTLPDYHFNDNW